MDYHGAKLTLQNGTFKHSKPSDFNDIDDLTIRGIFAKKFKNVAQEISQTFVSVILENLDKEPTISSPMKEKIQHIQSAMKLNPTAQQEFRHEGKGKERKFITLKALKE